MVTERRYSYGWKPQPYDARRAKYELIPEKADRSTYVTLDPYLSAIKDQRQTSACTAFSFTSAHEAAGRIIGANVVELSELDEYYWTRVAEGDCSAGQPCPDQGAMTDDSVNVPIRRGGSVPASAWPFDNNAAEVPPPADATASKMLWIDGFQPVSASAFVDGIIQAISNKQPFLMAFEVYNSWEQDYARTAVFSLRPTGGIAGGHQMNGACYIPADQSKPDTLPSGLVGFDNSWGRNSPPRPDIDPNPKAGRVYMHVETFSAQAVQEVIALVPKAQPAILSVSVQAPASIVAGQAAAFAATVAGAPQGTHLTYSWNFGDGTQGDGNAGATVSHIFASAGSYTVTCHVFVATTGAAADGSVQVSVGAAPSPPPSNLKQEIDAAQNALIAQLQQYASGDTDNMALYRYAEDVVAYDRDDLLDPLLSGNVPSRMAAPPRPRERN